MNFNSQFQPPLPKSYKTPPIVEPRWNLSSLFKFNDAKETLRKTICQQYGVKHCLLLDRARSGLYLLIKRMGLNNEWLTTSFMYRPSGILIKNHVKNLVFSSINEDFNMDVDDAKNLIDKNTQVILVTHMYGKAANITALRALADQRKLFLIENAVHTPGGVTIDNRKLGSWGDAAVLSFNVDKPAGAILGGALLTNRDDVWEAVSKEPLGKSNGMDCWERIYNSYLSYHLKPLILKLPNTNRFRKEKNGVEEIENFKLEYYTTFIPRNIHFLQASAAISGIKNSVQNTSQRVDNAEFLSSLLNQSDKLILPQSSKLTPHTYLYYPVILKEGINRFDIGRRLSELGIETKWRYYPLHLQPGFTDCRKSDMTKTINFWQQHLLLPCNAKANKDQLKYLADNLLNLITA